MKTNKNIVTISLLVVLTLAVIAAQTVYGEEYCYTPYEEDVRPEFVADISLVTIRWVEGERGMEAFASYYYDEETKATICLIAARMPTNVIGDPDMDTLGHELLHCLTGDFHKGGH